MVAMEPRKAYLLMVLWVAALLPPGTTEGHWRGQKGWGELGRRLVFHLVEEYPGTDVQYVAKLHSMGDPGDGSARYILSGEGAGTLFKIHERLGDLYATQGLDREEKAQYALHVKAVHRLTGKVLPDDFDFVVKIRDINDNAPRFTEDLYMATVPEMSAKGTSVIQVTATDADEANTQHTHLVYSILKGQPYFSVDSETGLIKVALPNMDREMKDKYQLVVQAQDMGGHEGALTGTTTVIVTLTDINDNPPYFTQTLYEMRVCESRPVGSALGVVRALDADMGDNAQVKYSIIDGNAAGVFHMETNRSSQEGVLLLRKPLDYEKQQQWRLRVQVENVQPKASFLRGVSFRDEATITVRVEDQDEPPVFERPAYVMEVREDAAKGTLMGRLSAADPDAKGSPIRYSIDRDTDLDGVLSVHAEDGSLSVVGELDRETKAWHNITIVASEIKQRQQSSSSSSVAVYVRVLDVNDNAPSFAADYNETLVCEDAGANQLIQRVSATDPDRPPGGHGFSFSLAQDAAEKAHFLLRDNKDNTASILTRHGSYGGLQGSLQYVPVVIWDSDPPVRSSTNVLRVRVCPCQRQGDLTLCQEVQARRGEGLSTGPLLAIVICLILLLGAASFVAVFAAARRRRTQMVAKVWSEEEGDAWDALGPDSHQGGGEEDTAVLLPPVVAERPRALPDKHADLRDFIGQELRVNDSHPLAPPYDSLIAYAYEGRSSPAGSLSSLESSGADGDFDSNQLSRWGPSFATLAQLYGVDQSGEGS